MNALYILYLYTFYFNFKVIHTFKKVIYNLWSYLFIYLFINKYMYLLEPFIYLSIYLSIHKTV